MANNAGTMKLCANGVHFNSMETKLMYLLYFSRVISPNGGP